MLTLIDAGAIEQDDGILGIMQNVSREHAEAIADWLAMATRGPVTLEFMATTLGDQSCIERITRTGPAEVKVGQF
jgi:hypothetical protein